MIAPSSFDPLGSPAKLLPLIRGHEDSQEILEQYLKLSFYQRELFLAQAEKLNKRPRVLSFQYDDQSFTDAGAEILLFKGSAKVSQTVWAGGTFKDTQGDHDVLKAVDSRGRFSFVYQDCGSDYGYATLAEVAPNYRGNGLLLEMVRSMHHVWFEVHGFRLVTARAAIPLNDPNIHDWRSERVFWKSNGQTGAKIYTTALHRMWLRTPLAVHGHFCDPRLEDDSIAWLSQKWLQRLPRKELEELDRTHPKAPENSFMRIILGA